LLQNIHRSLPIELFIGGQVDFAVTLSVNFLDDILGVSFGISQRPTFLGRRSPFTRWTTR
jgi:hypothetical protein